MTDVDDKIPKATALVARDPRVPALAFLASLFGVATLISSAVAISEYTQLQDAAHRIELERTYRESGLRTMDEQRNRLSACQRERSALIPHSTHLDWKVQPRSVDIRVASQCGDDRYQNTVTIPIP